MSPAEYRGKRDWLRSHPHGVQAQRIRRELRAWDALASVPAVRDRRVHLLVGDDFVVSGPRVVQATHELAAILHPEAVR